MYTDKLRFEHGAHLRPFNQPLIPQAPPPNDNMTALNTASNHQANRSHFRASSMPDFTSGGKMTGMRDQRTLYYAVDASNPWPSQVSLYAARTPSRHSPTSTSGSGRKDSTRRSSNDSSASAQSDASVSSQSRWHRIAKLRLPDKGPGRKLSKRSKPTTPSGTEPVLGLENGERGAGPTDNVRSSTSTDLSSAERVLARNLISTADYDYESHAKSRFSWLPFRNHKPHDASDLASSPAAGSPCSQEQHPVTTTESSISGDDESTELDTSVSEDVSSPQASDSVPATQSSTIDKGKPPATLSSSNEEHAAEEHNPTASQTEQPFWDINDNLSSRPRDAFDEPSEARSLLFSHEGGTIPPLKKPRKRTLKSFLRLKERNPLSTIEEVSEPSSSRASTPEILTARIQRMKSIELTAEKVRELMERRRIAQGRKNQEEEMPVILVTDPEGKGSFGRVDSVTEREKWLERERRPSFM